MFDLIDDAATEIAIREQEYQEWCSTESWIEDVNRWLRELANELITTEA